MLRRVLDAAGVVALTAPVLYSAACGGKVVVDSGCVGRPFLIDDLARTATVEDGDRGWSLGVLAPDVTGLDPDARRALAAAWTTDALLEHASIAAFARFSLELLAASAPADLVTAAHRAALDEVRHARICFALAQGYAGAPLGPSAFPFDGAIPLRGDLASLAKSTAREGCIGETLAAIVAAEQLARATDPAVRRALAAITEDEARHAELAWRTVAWAVEQGGEAVRDAVAEVFAEAAQHAPAAAKLGAIPASVLLSHGRLDAATTRDVLARTLDEVICPAFAALLHRAPAAVAVASAAA